MNNLKNKIPKRKIRTIQRNYSNFMNIWTPHEYRKLYNMYFEQKETIIQISESLGRTPNAVKQKIKYIKRG